MTRQLCECGCGQLANLGNRFINRHQSRTRRRGPDKYFPVQGRCPRCDQVVTFRKDGSPAAHWIVEGAVKERYRCPSGELSRRRKTRTGRRARVSINVVIPLDMARAEFAAIARRALMDALDAAFVVDIEVTETGEVAS